MLSFKSLISIIVLSAVVVLGWGGATYGNEQHDLTNTGPEIVVGYYADWSSVPFSNLPVQNMDVIDYAFADLDSDGTLSLPPNLASNFQSIAELKQINPQLKVLLSIGGWTYSENFSAVAASSDLRKAFADNIVKFLNKYPGFDGVDIDWEYPIAGNDIHHTPDDKINFNSLIHDIRTAMDSTGHTYYLTIASAHNSKQGDGGSVDNFDVKGLFQNGVNWIDIMAYDIYQSTSEPTQTNNAAALFQPATDTSINAGDDSVSASIADYKKQGLTMDEIHQLVLGIPLYGYGWKSVSVAGNDPNYPGLFATATSKLPNPYVQGSDGIFTYKTIVDRLISDQGLQATWWQQNPDDSSQPPYQFSTYYSPTTKAFVSFDDVQSATAKADYILSQGLGGAMFWELSGDATNGSSLLYNVGEVLGKKVVMPSAGSSTVVRKLDLSNNDPTQSVIITIIVNGNYWAFPSLAKNTEQLYDTTDSSTLAAIVKSGAGPYDVQVTPGSKGAVYKCAQQIIWGFDNKTPHIMVNPSGNNACAISYY